ncbi:MAG: Cu(I)-responsive transcriptional regulator [Myxococcota bacterium]
MRIKQAAIASGVSAKMIRYYESIGLVPAAERTDSGYRVYRDQDVHTLRFIRRARDLGFLVGDISALLSLWQNRSRRSSDVKRLAVEHIETLEAKKAEIQSMIDTLSELAASCHGDDRSECPILDDLDQGAASPPPAPHRLGTPSDRRKG